MTKLRKLGYCNKSDEIFRLCDPRMAEPCPSPNSDNISSTVTSESETKTDCASPSPTETISLDSLYVAGPSQCSNIKTQDKDVFLNKLGLDKVDECLDSSNDDCTSHDCEENWEDCQEILDDENDMLQVANVEVSPPNLHLNHY